MDLVKEIMKGKTDEEKHCKTLNGVSKQLLKGQTTDGNNFDQV